MGLILLVFGISVLSFSGRRITFSYNMSFHKKAEILFSGYCIGFLSIHSSSPFCTSCFISSNGYFDFSHSSHPILPRAGFAMSAIYKRMISPQLPDRSIHLWPKQQHHISEQVHQQFCFRYSFITHSICPKAGPVILQKQDLLVELL